MKKTVILLFLLICLLLIAGHSVFAASPSVTGVSGTLSHGSSVTISGSGFGTKATAAPWRWDPIEGVSEYNGLNNGDPIPSSDPDGYWTINNNDYLLYGTSPSIQRGVSTRNMYTNTGVLGGEEYKVLRKTLPSSTRDERYVSYWIWFSRNMRSDNSKTIRWRGEDRSPTSTLTIQECWPGGGPWYIKREDNTSTECGSIPYPSLWFTSPVGGKWERYEAYILDESTPLTSDDGALWVAQYTESKIPSISGSRWPTSDSGTTGYTLVDNAYDFTTTVCIGDAVTNMTTYNTTKIDTIVNSHTLTLHDSGYFTNGSDYQIYQSATTDGACAYIGRLNSYSNEPMDFRCDTPWDHLNYLAIGMDKNTSNPEALEIRMDDIYIDNTRARVEVCNSSTWAARTHCEIQIPSAWSGTSITTTLNQGSFSGLSGAYLYVVDSSGAVNANGYLLSSGDTTPPAAPQGLTVN